MRSRPNVRLRARRRRPPSTALAPVPVPAVMPRGPDSPAAPSVAAPVSNDWPRLEAVVDGRRVVVEAQDEIVLRCGEASVTLRRNGRIVVRGTYVETRSKGVNRIKGGTVQIN